MVFAPSGKQTDRDTPKKKRAAQRGHVNTHGLYRRPAGVCRARRQAAGFGRVKCGFASCEYEHIDPEFADAVAHDPAKMGLLCKHCHDEVTAAKPNPAPMSTAATRGWPARAAHAALCALVAVSTATCGRPPFNASPVQCAHTGKAMWPLTARDAGVYAIAPWLPPGAPVPTDSLHERTQGLTFGIRNVFVRSEEAAHDLRLENVIAEIDAGWLSSPKRRVLVRVDFWDGPDRYEGPVHDVDTYARRFEAALEKLSPVLDKVLGVSLSEENVPIGGRSAILRALYERAKRRFSVRLFQWWTPNTAVPAWYEGVFVPADGWIVDPYTLTPETYPNGVPGLGRDPYLRFIQKYLVTRKPLIAVLFASNEVPHFYDPTNTQNTTGLNMWRVVEHQFRVNQRYDVPTAFYWTDRSNAQFGTTTTDPLLGAINASVRDYVARCHATAPSPPNDVPPDLWSREDTTPLQFAGAGRFEYVEDFRTTKFLTDSSGRGFRDLAWDGERLGVSGFDGRPPTVVIDYVLTTTVPISRITVSLRGRLETPRASIRVSIDGDDSRGLAGDEAARSAGPVDLKIDASAVAGTTKREARVRVAVSAQCGDTLAATIDEMRVEVLTADR